MAELESGSGEVLEIVVLYCRQAAAVGAAPIDETRRGEGVRARMVVEPCSSQIEVSHILRILQRGTDGVLLVACPEERCRMLTGSTMAGKRVERARALLAEANVDPGRVVLHRGGPHTSADLLALVERHASTLRGLAAATKGEAVR